jgi:hypothetical protein
LSVWTAAQARPNAPAMTCDQARALVKSSGAVVLSTGQYTYDRFVATPGYCLPGEIADRTWIQTGDTDQCPIGFVCKIRPPRFRD